MTINLYVTSTQNFSGKSAVCVALMHRLQKDGYKVGYLKPFSSAARVLAESSIDEDARFVKETFGLSESLDVLAPVVLTDEMVKRCLTEPADYSGVVVEAAKKVGQGKDVVVMEGSANLREGRIVNLSPTQAAELVDAKAITVVSYSDSLQMIDDIWTAQMRLGERLAGVIINNVPLSRFEYVKDQVATYLKHKGVPLLAVLPHEKILGAISINEIVEALDGKLLCPSRKGELVENMLVAAMDVDQALTHFRRVTHKAVIVGGDRPDIQLVAMETSTRVLILTGSTPPNPMIQAKAEELGIAIILSRHDTLTTVEKVEQFFGKTPFHQTEKIERFEQLFDQCMDMAALYGEIGLK